MEAVQFDRRSDDERAGDRAALMRAFDDFLSSWYSLAPRSAGDVLEDDLEVAAGADVLDLMRVLAELRRRVDVAAAIAAREVDRRSDPIRGAEGLARRHGCRNGSDLVAELLRVEARDAAALVRVGRAIVGERGLTGDRVPPKAEHVAEAMRGGEIGVAHANEVVALRARLAPRVEPEELDIGERELVETARDGMRLRDFRKVCARVEAHLDPDGVAPSLEAQRRERSLTIRTDVSTGMVHLRGRFDAESGAYIAHGLEAYTTGQLRTSRGRNVLGDPAVPTAGERSGPDGAVVGRAPEEAPGTAADESRCGGASSAGHGSGVHFAPTASLEAADQVTVDTRSVVQMQADAMVEFCKHVLGCDHSRLPGPSTTVVVRMGLDDLVDVDEPVPVAETAAANGFDPTDGAVLRVVAARRSPEESRRPVEVRSLRPRARQAGAAAGARRGSAEDVRDAPRLRESARPGDAEPNDASEGIDGPEGIGALADGRGQPADGTRNFRLLAISGSGRGRSREAEGASSLRDGPRGVGGLAEIDGGPVIDAGAARRLAASAGLIPMVLGGDGEVLDLGRERRQFTRAQRLALVERDGGCAMCGLPPGMTEAHHVRWWHAHDGRTDLDNGVLLCTNCHHRMHEGWQVRIAHAPDPANGRDSSSRRGSAGSRRNLAGSRGPEGSPGPAGDRDLAGGPDPASSRGLTSGGAPASGGDSARGRRSGSGRPSGSRGGSGTVWFIPPGDVDWQQRPRLGGRKRFDPIYRREHPPIPLPGYADEP
ncbi:HNH endonuclease signature motif containing protein [Gulosibacter sp. 10]|uniref:HNH endonuclease n=1 Tax=Gulosibacter sp. 10 TaxID=1255570 RepID=UPI000B3536C2|nr:HNH endonuclease signature motif containing protein [Gulosibacter sp. 10]